MNICSICNSAPATVHLSSFDIDQYCSSCRYTQGVIRALKRKRTGRKRKSVYYPCS